MSDLVIINIAWFEVWNLKVTEDAHAALEFVRYKLNSVQSCNFK